MKKASFGTRCSTSENWLVLSENGLISENLAKSEPIRGVGEDSAI